MGEIAEQNYTRELKKATYYVKEIADTLKSDIKEDLLLAQEKICEINKTLENSANAVKDAMLDKEKSFEGVRAWSNARKEDLIPVHELRSRLKEKLGELEKHELHRREEDWFKKKLEQKYTITPFWNQFVVEVDSSKISEISKFNYLLELLKGEPKGHILGLPHTAEGYHEAKKILETIYGKDIKVHKALIKDFESLPNITSANRVKEIHDFHSQLS